MYVVALSTKTECACCADAANFCAVFIYFFRNLFNNTVLMTQEQSTVLKCPSQDGTAQTPIAAPSLLGTHLRSVNRLDSPSSPLHCHALHNQSRVPASPALHSRAHSPNISNMAALRSVKVLHNLFKVFPLYFPYTVQVVKNITSVVAA